MPNSTVTTSLFSEGMLMRLATLIISLVLMLVLGLQSCAILAGGGLAESLSTAASEKQEAQDLAGGGAIGLFVALLWLVAAGLVLGKPKASMWLFIVAGVLALLGGGGGFSDLFIWAGASLISAIMSWRGVKEKASKDEEERARYRADVQAASQQAPVR